MAPPSKNNLYSKLLHTINEFKIADWEYINPDVLVNEIKSHLYETEQHKILNQINERQIRTYKLYKTSESVFHLRLLIHFFSVACL